MSNAKVRHRRRRRSMFQLRQWARRFVRAFWKDPAAGEAPEMVRALLLSGRWGRPDR